jgi:hypothetical protein
MSNVTKILKYLDFRFKKWRAQSDDKVYGSGSVKFKPVVALTSDAKDIIFILTQKFH